VRRGLELGVVEEGSKKRGQRRGIVGRRLSDEVCEEEGSIAKRKEKSE
jgi:hypothetical protein